MGTSHHLISVSLNVLIVLWYIVTIIISKGASLPCIPTEREALLHFKSSVIDPSHRLSSWVGEDCCEWKGVKCDDQNGHVIELDLQNPGLFNKTRLLENNGYDPVYANSCLASQEVSPSLLNLTHLQYLDLSWNNFSGISIPNFFGSFGELRHLNLSSSYFRGLVPHHLGNISTLQFLDINSEVYEGQLSVGNLNWVSRLSNLKYLDMSFVDLSHASDSLHAINFLPHLLELHLHGCGINQMSISYANLTSLVVLDFGFNNFQGSLPNYLQNMTSLQVLDLARNNFNGTVKNYLDQLCNLTRLDFSDNRLQGDITELFGNSSSLCFKNNKLESLRLRANQLSGHIPQSLCKLSSLKLLSLDENQLNGTIPECLGQLSHLQFLDLSSNSFSGSIPSSVGQLSHLKFLDLSNNSFCGSIPSSVGQLSQLVTLSLSYNSLEGVISETFFAKLSNLKILRLAANSLVVKIKSEWVPPFQLSEIELGSCKMGPEFPMWLRTQKTIKHMNISRANITDSVPPWLFSFSSSYTVSIVFSFNALHGKIPKIYTSTNVAILDLDLSHNNIDGYLPHFPSNTRIIDLSHNFFSGPIYQNFGVMVPRLEALLLSNNSINGTIPDSFCQLKSLKVLDLSENNLSGGIPHCWSDMQALIVLDFSSNNLSGIIPTSMGNFVGLQFLHLSRNILRGQIPSSLKKCTLLSTLDLGKNKFSGNIPTWIGEKLANLRFLNLQSNRFNGVIPLQLCKLVNLQYLDLAYNEMSGTIPSCFRNFSGMISVKNMHYRGSFGYIDKITSMIKGKEREYTKTLSLLASLDLSSNEFVGWIPEELTKLIGLQDLNLSNNHLSGTISEKIGKMVLLESLDLSENRLSGKIPQSLSLLYFLSHLNLSHNQFSGKIPIGGQLQTLNDPSIYSGNLELCGAPLEKCVDDEPSLFPTITSGMSENEEDESEMKWFYIGMASGHVVGFWGVCGVLFFKRSWRIAYFQFLTSIGDRLLVTVVGKVAQLKKKLKRNQVEG